MASAPKLKEYLELSQDSYQLGSIFGSGGTYTPPDGYTVVLTSAEVNAEFLGQGFAAVALRDLEGNIILQPLLTMTIRE